MKCVRGLLAIAWCVPYPLWAHYEGFPLETPNVTGTFMEYRTDHFHGGVDLTPGVSNNFVRPVADGTVHCVPKFHTQRQDGSAGRDTTFTFWIDHPNGEYAGLATRYMHIGDYAKADMCGQGHAITTGDTLGTIVTPLDGYPDHLHFEVRRGTRNDNADYINPLSRLPDITDEAVDYASSGAWSWIVVDDDGYGDVTDITSESSAEADAFPPDRFRLLFQGFDRVNTEANRVAFYSIKAALVRTRMVNGEAMTDSLLRYSFTADEVPRSLIGHEEYLYNVDGSVGAGDGPSSGIRTFYYRLFARDDSNNLSIVVQDSLGNVPDTRYLDLEGYIDSGEFDLAGQSARHHFELEVRDYADEVRDYAGNAASKRLLIRPTGIGDSFGDLAAQSGTRQVALSWYRFRAADWEEFQVQRSRDGGVSFSTVGRIAYDTTSQDGLYEYVDRTATDDVLYYYRIFTDELYGPISARPKGGNSVPLPGTPVISVGATGGGFFNLNMDEGADYADSYRVEYGPAAESFPWNTSLSGESEAEISDQMVTSGTFKVRVRGRNRTGHGSFSNEARFTVAAPSKPARPSGTVHAVRPGADRGWVLMNWMANPEDDIRGYRVYCFDGTDYQPVADVNGSSWSSLGADIWPTDGEIADGRYALHADGSGTDLKMDPRQVYVNSPSSTHDESSRYYFAVRAKNTLGNLSELSDPWTPTLPGISGTLVEDETWAGYVPVSGDVTVPVGITLVIDPGSVVGFSDADRSSAGRDPNRVELVVEGTLDASAGPITFRSINEDPSSLEWYGIRVESGGAATLTDVTVQDGVHCAKAESGGTLNRTRVALSNCGTSPQVEGDRAVAYAEQGEGTEPTDRLVATYRATDAEDDEVSWALAGPDMQRLILSVGGELRFPDASPPDFEAPAGSQGNTYRVTVRAEDSQQATTEYPVTVTVTNVDEPGSVVLSRGTPQVDQEVTATLRDPDGGLVVRAEDWQWQGRAPGSTTWVTLSGSTAGRSVPPSPEAPERSSYTPASEHAGWLLRAVVNHYEDGHGPGKRAHSEATEPVQDVPGPPRKLKATPGDRQVALKWSAPASDGGSAITGYAYQDSVAGGAWSGWQSIEGSDGSTRRHTVGNLTNGTEYTFAVRAVNAVGAGASVRVPATPRRPDTPGRVEVGPTQPRVGETLKPTLVDPDTPVEVTGWRWRRLASWDRSADIDSASAPPSSERWTQVVGRTRKYKPVKADLGRRLRVEVDYTDRSGAQGARATTPAVQAGPPCAPPDLAAAAGDEDGQVELTWAAACNHGSAIRQYQYQHLGASAWEPVSGDGSARRQVVDGLTAGQTYPFQVRARNGVGPGPPSQVTVALPDPDPPDDPPPPRPGTITLEPSIAQTCARLTATLRDPDGGIDLEPSHSPTTEPTFTYGWVWDPRSFPSDGPASAATSVTQDYTPPNSSVGRFIEVTARYGDNRSDRNEVLVRSGTVVANTPRTPGRLAGAAGDGQVDLSWTAPDDCGSDITHYDYRVRPNPSGAWSAWQDTTATSVTVSPLTNDVEYTFEVRAHNGRGASRVAAITRRPLSNAPDPPDATLTLTNDDPPYSRTPMVANFSHPGSGTVTQWAWYRLTRADQEESSDNHITGQITNRYVPREADLNHWIRVIATYNDNHAQGRTVAATTAQAVQRGDDGGTITFTGIDPPLVNREITATLHDDDKPTNLAWQWDVVGAAGARPEGRIDEGNTYTPGSGHVGSRIRAQVIYDDDFGTGKIVRNTTPVVQASSTLTLTEISKQDVRENTQRLAGVYESIDPQGRPVAWSLIGTDPTSFQLRDVSDHGNRKELRFRTAPNYESKSSYSVTVRVSAAGVTKTRTVPVTVLDGPDTGTITLAPTTTQTCARIAATLRDEDSGLHFNQSLAPAGFTYGWLWDPRYFPSDGGQAASVTTQDYIPPNSSVGQWIEVTVRYGDDQGDREEVLQRSSSRVVANTPRTPGRLAGAAGDGQVDLSWTAPDDCGSDITHYDYRVRPNPSGAWSAWQDTTATSVTVSPLTNDVEYTFEVRAHNGRGASRVAAITRRPLSNTTLTLTADDPPYVLTPMVANFSHPGSGTVTQWAWYRLTRADQEESSDNHITGQITNRYVPREADLNHWIRVIATYNDNHAQGRTVAATTAQAVQRGDDGGTITFTGIDPPLVNREITATLHDDDKPTNLAWQWDVVGAAGARPEGRIDEGNTYTPGSGHVGSRIRAQVIYDDDFGTGKIVRNTTPVVQASSTLTLTEISKQDVRENTQRLAGVYESIDPQGRPVAWSLIGTDPTSFQLRDVSDHGNRKELRFRTAPNYESKSSYSVTVRVSAAGVTKTRTVPVTVRVSAAGVTKTRTVPVTVLDGPDTGTITLAPTTTQTCARIAATLRDEDSGLHFNQSLAPAGFTYGWLWDPRYFPSDGGQAASVTTQDYIPPNSSVGQWIEVTVRYGDDQGDREEVLQRSSGRVLANTPRVPTLSGTAGVGQVALSWTKPGDCGSTSLWGANGPR